jgi:16S rRNA (adenine1518-N6/adenine1519-N6)-dimethyltransferase
MNSDQLKALLQKYNLKPNFTYGQNFLVDEIVLEDIVDAAEVSAEDCVLEIGPGIGNLTRRLCERAKLVLSVEKDPKFQPILKSIKKDHKNFRWEIADALEYDFQKFFADEGCEKFKVVANIPYYITGKILQMFMTAQFKPSSITVLTQKEVARNVTAGVGGLSMLAISVQLYGEPSLVKIVPAKSFYPAPKVDSAVLQIKLFDKPKYDIGDEKKFFGVLRACFSGKRKQIHNTLKNNLKLSKEQVDAALSSAKINPAARPQELSIEQWISLVNKI